MFYRLLHIVFCLSLLSLSGGEAAFAQNNAYGIRDDLFDLFVFAIDNSFQSEGLEAADSMYRKAQEISDGKSMCLAQTIPVRYYSECEKRDSLFKCVDRLGATAIATGYAQYYYYAEESKIVYDLNHNLYGEAIRWIDDVWHRAFRQDSLSYGRCVAMRALGHLYASLYDRDLAIKQYKEALDYMRVNVAGQDITETAVRIGELYLAKGELDSASVYCDMALKSARTSRIQSIALMLRSRILFDRGDADAFRRAYTHAFNRILNRDVLSDSTSLYLFFADKAIDDGNRRIALHYASRLTGSVDRYDELAKVYEHFGEYDNALDAVRRGRLALDSLRSDVILEQISILDRRILDPQNRSAYLDIAESSKDKGSHDLFWFYMFVAAVVLLVAGSIVSLMCFGYYKGKFRHRLGEAEERAEESRLAIEMAERARTSSYLQTVGRNMRNPLNAIVGFTQLLSDTDAYLSADLRNRYSGIIRANSNLLLALVDDMTDISELEMQLGEMSLSEVSPNAVVRDAIAMFEARSLDGGAYNIKLDFVTEISDDYVILSDSVHLRQVINQLLSNAEKFTNNLDGGNIRIEVSLSENLGKLTIAVSDTGIGVPPEQAEAIFGKFVKLNKAVPGNGLGLCLARMIVTHLDGELYLDTGYTAGARFVILLPVGGM